MLQHSNFKLNTECAIRAGRVKQPTAGTKQAQNSLVCAGPIPQETAVMT
jgi:hypothetical protein